MTPEEVRRLARVVREHADGAVLRVRVVPRASRTALAGRRSRTKSLLVRGVSPAAVVLAIAARMRT